MSISPPFLLVTSIEWKDKRSMADVKCRGFLLSVLALSHQPIDEVGMMSLLAICSLKNGVVCMSKQRGARLLGPFFFRITSISIGIGIAFGLAAIVSHLTSFSLPLPVLAVSIGIILYSGCGVVAILYSLIRKLFPRSARYYAHQGSMYLRNKHYQEALQNFHQALLLKPTSARWYYQRGLVYSSLKEYPLALQDLEQALLLGRGRWCMAAYRVRGQIYVWRENYPEALHNDQRALALASKRQQAFFYDRIGYTLLFLKEYEQAVQACNQAIALVPRYPIAYNTRGRAYLGLMNLTQARSDFEHAYQLGRQDVNAGWYAEWARLCREKGEGETVKRLNSITKADPQCTAAYACRGVAYWIQGEYEKALRELLQAIEKEPIQWGGYFWKGVVDASLHRDDEAREAIHMALAKSMPVILLSPLCWLEQARPDFYNEFAFPLLQAHTSSL